MQAALGTDRLPVPHDALIELGLTEEQVRSAVERRPRSLGGCPWEADGAEFDVGAVAKVLKALGTLRHTKTRRWQGSPLRPDPWQVVWVIAPVFGWKYRRDHPDGELAGARVVREVFVEVPRKNGKGLDVETPMLTAAGWKRFGDLQVGDLVHAEDGSLTEVTYVSPERTLDCYRVTFGDGQTLVCDSEHVWRVWDRYGHDPSAWASHRGKGAWRTIATPELAETHRCGARGDTRYSVSSKRIIDRPTADLPIDPYLLGVWLGDGETRGARIATVDPQILQAFVDAGYELGANNAITTNILGLHKQLRELGVLGNKHVPDVYLTASQDQRLALLRGLMDTDGGVNTGGNTPRVEFVSTRQQLADAVVFLARSLGWKPSILEFRTKLNGRDCGPGWRVAWTAYSDRSPFSLDRKTAKLHAPPGRATRSSTNVIARVDPAEPVPTRCIQVAHDSKQFLAGRGLIPTHNTTVSTGLLLVLLAADGEPGAEVYTAAVDRPGAQRILDDAKTMVQASPALRRKLQTQATLIRSPSNNGIMRALSKYAEAAHGLNVSGAVIDELHVHRTRDLLDAILTGTGARDQPLTIIITTADEGKDHTIYAEQHQRTLNAAERIVVDPSYYGVIWAADESDDPFASETIAKANPGAGTTVTWDYLRAQAEKARTTPSYLPTYLRLHLNLRRRSRAGLIDLKDWDHIGAVQMLDRRMVDGQSCWGGMDLSSTTDLTAAALLFPGEDGMFRVLAQLWVPEDRLEQLETLCQVPLSQWVKDGWLATTEGNVVDYRAVRKWLVDASRRFDLREVGYDPWNATETVTELAEAGIEMTPVRQGYASMSSPTKSLEKLVKMRRVLHGGHPVLRWHASALEVVRDQADNVKPVKPERDRSSQRIDGMVATINALYAWQRRPVADEGDTAESLFY